MKLAWVTDIHLELVTRPEAEAFCRTLVDSEPDALLVSGDIAQSGEVEDWLHFLEARLQRPIYFVLGNHDYYYGTIGDVRARIAACARGSRWLCWLDAADVTPLTAHTSLVGHGAWADGRLGTYGRSRLKDFRLIDDFCRLGPRERRARLAALGDEAAAHFHRVLPRALERAAHVILLTHYPPFPEACWEHGHPCDDDVLPYYGCHAVGAVLLELMQGRPDRRLTVLCGHTHEAASVQILSNLLVRVGRAQYGAPELQSLLVID